MRLANCAVVLSVVVALSGCSQGPVPAPRSVSNSGSQPILAGVEHWQTLAEDTAANVVACLDGSAPERQCARDRFRNRPVYVERVETALPFARAYHELLTAEFLRQGREVSLRPEGAVVVRYRIQHIARSSAVAVDSVPGTHTLFGAGIAAASQWGAAPLVGWGLLADAHSAVNSQGRSQVVITVSLTDDDRLIMQRSAGYFIPTADDRQFVSTGPVIDLVHAPRSNTPPTEMRDFPVVGQ